MTDEIKQKALNLLENEVNSKNYNPYFYLNYLTTYLQNTTDISVKKYISEIRKTIKFLQNHFDEEYLLIFNYENNVKYFDDNINLNFIEFVDDFIFILNEKDYIDEVDKLSEIKGKLELGYMRYFSEKKNLKVKLFSKDNLEFEIKESFENEINFTDILGEILRLKKTNNSEFKARLNEINDYIEYFPNQIYNQKNLKYFEIQKSLFPDLTFEIKEFKKGKEHIIIKDLNDLDSANLILKILSENE